ncbi:putative hydroxylase [Rhodovulum sp. P5]|uniref:VOC family protein n=1 Tax=Rhodovulum sp. P5 TaxID=1564506 RepID=UPI0009C32A3F|nr:VOC family protein [Rhodovulum sp. P5]ARE38855.1 putative hydroxylase [Rhodovulum sp. P5]
MSQNHGKVWWTELRTRDVQGALKYYRAVCGWHFEQVPMGPAGYYVGKRGDQAVLGVMDMSNLQEAEGRPPHWFSYFAVKDVDKAVEQTRERAGQVIKEPFEIPFVGRVAIVTDPTGAAFGLIKPA